MKHKKQIFMLILVAFLLVGLGTLAASDVTKNDTITNTEKNTKISTENNIKDTTKTQTTQEKQIQKTQKVNKKQDPTPTNITNYHELANALGSGSGTKILNITKNITLEGNLTLTTSITNLTINGNQKIINGNGQYRFLTINSGQSVTINNITITNCIANMTDTGGAIHNNGTLTITNTKLNNNKAGHGGAIFNDGTLNINNTNITHNTANGRASNGGAIYNTNWGIININNTNLNNNTAIGGGAISNQNGTLTVTYSNLTNNTAFITGGAIKNYGGTLKINNTNITHNTANAGGAIYNSGTSTINNSTLNNNTANGGGAIYNDGGTLTITDSNLQYITPTDGGTIYINGGTVISIRSITEYQALVDAIEEAKKNTYSIYKINLLSGDYDATQSIVWEDSATRNIILNGNKNNLNGKSTYQFIEIAEEHNLTLENITISNYTAEDEGAIHNNGTLNINNTNLTHNTANWNGYGGAIYNDGGTLTITDSNLSHNNVNGEFYGDGGAICNQYGTLNITNSNLNNNTAYNGGAIHNQYGNLTIINSNLTNNTAYNGGAIDNNWGTLTIINSNLTNNTAKGYYGFGGAIYNYEAFVEITNSELDYNTANNRGGAISNQNGTLTVTYSNLTNNNANMGGTIYDITNPQWNNMVILFNSNFTENKAENGAVIYNYGGYGTYNITYNTFKNNTATSDNETLNLGQKNRERILNKNTYDNTDINPNTIILITKDQKTKYPYGEDILLNYICELTNPDYYDNNVLEYYNKTLYIDTIENSTTNKKNYTLSTLEHGKHTLYYKIYNSQSNNLTLIVPYDSEITTDKTTYDHINGIKNNITFNINDPTLENGTITITVKDPDGEKNLSSYPNIANRYQLSTDAIIEALENIYDTLNPSYVINVTYSSECTNPSSTKFTLNIIQKRNTTITYEILNNTERNVQINITVLDAIYKIPIPDAHITITGALTNQTTTGTITDNTLTPGKYNITVTFPETENYNTSETTINFNVEIDKDQKIAELEEDLEEANNNIEELNTNLTDANNKINELNNNLTKANNKIEELNNNLTITTEKLNNATNKINNLEKQVENAEKTITNLTQGLNNAKQENQKLNKEIQELKEQQKYTNEILNKLKEELNKLNHTTTITVQQNGNTIGNTTLTANLENKLGNPIKNAPIKATTSNGTIIGQATTNYNGQATIPLNTTTDKETIKVIYDGDGTYYKTETNITITLNKNNVTIQLNPIRGIIGENITLQAYLTDTNGNPISGGNLAFKLNGKTLRSDGRFDSKAPAMKFSVKNGVVTYTIKADLYLRNAKNLTASYSGSSKYIEKTSDSVEAQIQKRYANITVTVTPNKVKQYDTITIKVTAKDTTKNGKNTTLITDNTKVMLKINGVTLKDNKGKTLYIPIQKDKTATYKYTIPADMGAITSTGSIRNYPVTAIFVGDNYYPGARNVSNFQVERSNTTVTIQETKVVSKTNSLSIKATLTDYKGNKLKGTSKVTIKINGKNYIDPKTKTAKYWSVTDGTVNLKDIQVDPKTTIKRVMIVAGETQAYKEGRKETTNIIRV